MQAQPLPPVKPASADASQLAAIRTSLTTIRRARGSETNSRLCLTENAPLPAATDNTDPNGPDPDDPTRPENVKNIEDYYHDAEADYTFVKHLLGAAIHAYQQLSRDHPEVIERVRQAQAERMLNRAALAAQTKKRPAPSDASGDRRRGARRKRGNESRNMDGMTAWTKSSLMVMYRILLCAIL